jgi:hypothetical protein
MLNSSPAPAIPANFTRQPDGAFVDTETGEVYETPQRQRATWRAILEFYDQHPDGTPREAAQHVKFVLGE